MAAPLVRHAMRRCLAHNCAVTVRRGLRSGATPSVFTRLLLKLDHYFYDVESFLYLKEWWKTKVVKFQNKYFGYVQKRYGAQIGAAYYILAIKGSFRFAGQSQWFRPDSTGMFSFMRSPHGQIEEVDLSGTLINHNGLGNLISQNKLKTLSFRGCPEVDDWFLASLHVFGDSLVELDLSDCTHVTVGGLAALQNLRKLKRLDISGLPRLQCPGLVRILLEEMLPHCQVIGVESEQGMIQPERQEPTDIDDASTHSGLRRS